jgi:GntR family transcriptional regulator
MKLLVDTTSAVPAFEQLRQQIETQVADGTLPPGTQLPTVRRLAADLGLAPNTVARTYRELEQSGLVRTAGRRGTVVAEPAPDPTAEARRTTDRFVATMRGLGMTVTDAVQLVHRAYDSPAGP